MSLAVLAYYLPFWIHHHGSIIVDARVLLLIDSGNDVNAMLTGLVPVFNSYAIEWCKAMGFSFLVKMPCAVWRESRLKNYDGYIYYVLREQYHG